MKASLVIRTKDEADRLRLTLTSVVCQTEPVELIVVNDGSSDHTAEVIAEAASRLDPVIVNHACPKGRSDAANAGANVASGDILIFLDGDTLAAPDLVARHLALHRRQAGLVVRGETWHLRCTRMFQDPETGSPRPNDIDKVARLSARELLARRVTRQQIRESFGEIEARGQPGIYPGFGPRRLYELEMEALSTQPGSRVLWAAASGANQSVGRSAFIDSGGFHTKLTINEHRELALRLCNQGLRMAACAARSYHMIHRTGWRDPLIDREWEVIFYEAHPIPEVALLNLFWESVGNPSQLPGQSRMLSLRDLETAADRYKELDDMLEVRNAHLRMGGFESDWTRA